MNLLLLNLLLTTFLLYPIGFINMLLITIQISEHTFLYYVTLNIMSTSVASCPYLRPRSMHNGTTDNRTSTRAYKNGAYFLFLCFILSFLVFYNTINKADFTAYLSTATAGPKPDFPTENTGYPRPATNYKPATPGILVEYSLFVFLLCFLPQSNTPEPTLAFQLKLLFLFLQLISKVLSLLHFIL